VVEELVEPGYEAVPCAKGRVHPHEAAPGFGESVCREETSCRYESAAPLRRRDDGIEIASESDEHMFRCIPLVGFATYLPVGHVGTHDE